MSGQGSAPGGRYNRSVSGLIGAMVLTVVVVVGFALFRDAFSKDLDQGAPDEIEYLDAVQGLQANGFEVVYPPVAPEGWIVTAIDFDPGERPRFGLNLYTDQESFVGIRQSDDDVDDLLEEYAVDDATEDDPLLDTGTVAAQWQAWSDPDGDHAYSTTLGEDTVLVYGAVPADELARLVEVLSVEVIATPAPATSPTS